MSDRTVELIVTIGGAIVVVVVVRWLLNLAFRAFERRHAGTEPTAVARQRTTWLFVQRVILAVVVASAAWVVLSQFDVTRSVARALLASGAVVALFAGIAFSVPLSNLGSGMLVVFSQPLRLADRVTIGEHTGFVEDISLLYTTLATDDELRVSIPNIRLTEGPIVNRTIQDARRSVSASFLVPIGADLDRVLSVLRESTLAIDELHDEPAVLVGDILTSGTLRLVRVDVRAYAPLTAAVDVLESDVRRAGLAALEAHGFLGE